MDETSEACAFSVIDRASTIRKKSSVWSSSVSGSEVCRSQVISSIITKSLVTDSLITGGMIENSHISSAELVADFALIKNSFVGTKSRIVHTAYLENVKVENLTVSGDARLVGWHNKEVFDGREGYISRGLWTRPPKILRLPAGLTITESVPSFAFCGCREFAISHWLKIGDRYGKTLGLSPEDVARIRQFLISLETTQKKMPTQFTTRNRSLPQAFYANNIQPQNTDAARRARRSDADRHAAEY